MSASVMPRPSTTVVPSESLIVNDWVHRLKNKCLHGVSGTVITPITCCCGWYCKWERPKIVTSCVMGGMTMVMIVMALLGDPNSRYAGTSKRTPHPQKGVQPVKPEPTFMS